MSEATANNERVSGKTQRIIELSGVIAALLTTVLYVGVWTGRMQEQHKEFRTEISTLKCEIQEEEVQRKAEYLQLKMKLSDLEVKLEGIETGQEWIIMKMKGEI